MLDHDKSWSTLHTLRWGSPIKPHQGLEAEVFYLELRVKSPYFICRFYELIATQIPRILYRTLHIISLAHTQCDAS